MTWDHADMTPGPSPSELSSAPELFGMPVVILALIVSVLSFAIAIAALVWQVLKHFLDGGRVKVYLNTAIWEPDSMLATNRSGRFKLQNDQSARGVVRGDALELAQLVVENPGRIPVTIYSPGLCFRGAKQKKYSIVPRMFSTDGTFGPDEAVSDTIVRLDPYGRVTFLLDYWGVMPKILAEAPTAKVVVRGSVGVAGRTKRPQKSSWNRRWTIHRGMYTAITGSPKFTPISVIWRELYVQLPKHHDEASSVSANGGKRLTRGLGRYVLEAAMSDFDERPDRKLFQNALEDAAKKYDRLAIVGIAVFNAYAALDRMDGHLTDWTEGLTLVRKETESPGSAEGSALD